MLANIQAHNNQRKAQLRSMSAAKSPFLDKGKTAEYKNGVFVGACPELHGHIFDCGTRNDPHGFTESKNALSIFAGSKYTNGADIRLMHDRSNGGHGDPRS